jgi:hypothetical protein
MPNAMARSILIFQLQALLLVAALGTLAVVAVGFGVMNLPAALRLQFGPAAPLLTVSLLAVAIAQGGAFLMTLEALVRMRRTWPRSD